MGVAENVMAQYPMLAFLLGDAEIGPLLTQAVDPNAGFSPETFQAKLMGTNWWRSRTESARKLEIERNTDPATFNARQQQYGDTLQQVASNMGVWLDGNQRAWLTAWGMGSDIPIDSQTMRNELVRITDASKLALGGGTMGVSAQDITIMANRDWLTPLSHQDAAHHAKMVAAGNDTMESLNARWRAEAFSRYPHLGDRLLAGSTLGEIAAPVRNTVARELEIDPSAVDVIYNPTWNRLLSMQDENGNLRIATESESMVAARSQNQWWQTSNGRKTDAEMASGLLQAFGKRA